MPDPRTYIRVHDGMDEHPKIEPLSDAAFRLLMSCWFYCSRQLTDGRISDAAWRKRGTVKSRRELVVADLVHERGHRCEVCPQPPAGHVQMHDYLEHQRSAAEVEELRRKRSEAGRRGGRARADAKQVLEQTGSKTEAVTETESEVPTERPDEPDQIGPGFEEFYSAYPRKEARRKAEQAWRSALKRADAETIMAGLKRFRFSDERRFVPLPASWLNADRWADQPPAPALVGATSGGGLMPWEL